MNHSELILGVDGGGTRSLAWLASGPGEAQVIGRGQAGPSNPQAVGVAAAIANLEQAIGSAFAAAGLSRGAVGAACLGLAGVDRPSDRAPIEQWAVQTAVGKQLKIVNDAMLLLQVDLPDTSGVALIVGTGSLAVGCHRDGRTARSGGWGHLFGDEGSGYAIAVAGLRAAAQAADGRAPHSDLLPRFLAALDCREPASLVPAIYQSQLPRAQIAALAQLVFAASDTGDPAAIAILAQAASALSEMVSAVIQRLDLDRQQLRLVLSGGVAVNQPILRKTLRDALGHRGVGIESLTVVAHPVVGAVAAAQRMLSH